jgi:hypothetical protein
MKRPFKATDLKILTDEQIAFLTFAVEREMDNAMREGNYNQSFRSQADALAGSIQQEYNQRKLHFRMFQKEE